MNIDIYIYVRLSKTEKSHTVYIQHRWDEQKTKVSGERGNKKAKIGVVSIDRYSRPGHGCAD